jgi:hypothetical protein
MEQSELNKLFEYRDGNLYWKVDKRSVHVGDKVGSKRADGYCRTKINQKEYLLHRLIFCMHHGYLPKSVDHIDGNPSNNCIENLRECSHGENMMNSKAPKTNKSGTKGVSWNVGSKKWQVRIQNKNKCVYLGVYEDKELAELVAIHGRKDLHGEFARHK